MELEVVALKAIRGSRIPAAKLQIRGQFCELIDSGSSSLVGGSHSFETEQTIV